MGRTLEKSKGRKGAGRFAGIPHAVMRHPDYLSLSAVAIRLLLELVMQFNGHNNGDLTAAWTVMKQRGFKSPATLSKALQELLEREFLICTRMGRFQNPGRQCSLYALAWQPINECPGKRLEVDPTRTPPRAFSIEISKSPTTETVSTEYRNCIHEGINHAD